METFRFAPIFGDSCVLQRDKPIKVFGYGIDGKTVRVSLNFVENGSKISVCGEAVVSSGRWMCELKAVKAMRGCTLTAICAGEAIELVNVNVGEVWLCGGQSNMEFELQNCVTGRQHLEQDEPDVRFYYTPKKALTDPDFYESENNSAWSVFSRENAKCWSAVGYIFAQKLSCALGVCVGLIGCNWGGTSASYWMPKQAIAEDADTAVYIEEYERGIAGKSLDIQQTEYRQYLAEVSEWNRRYDELLKQTPGIDWAGAEKILGKNPWPGPKNEYNPFRPGALYESMLMRICPYTLRGFLFYQGESDDHRPNVYFKLFSRMIKCWRESWQDDAPFLFVQLPGHRYAGDPDYKHWCIIRQAQREVSKRVKNAHMICAIDAGEFNEIHPKDKEPIGDRLYRLAMCKIYGELDSESAESPEITDVKFEDAHALVKFSLPCESDSLNSEIRGFELAGEDMEYKSAAADLSEDGLSAFVSAREIQHPRHLRYLWTNYPEHVDIYSKSGLPLMPFGEQETNQ